MGFYDKSVKNSRLWIGLKNLWWESPLPDSVKQDIFYAIRGKVKGRDVQDQSEDTFIRYAEQVLSNQFLDNSFSIDYPKPPFFDLKKDDPKFIAFYLPQYYPDPHNEKWWGKGSTEWTNVAKAAAQYVGQNQPRMPGNWAIMIHEFMGLY